MNKLNANLWVFNIALFACSAFLLYSYHSSPEMPEWYLVICFAVLAVCLLIAGTWKIIKMWISAEEKYMKTIETFLVIAEEKFPHFRGHAERVAQLTQMVLNRLKLTNEEQSAIEYAALLHDIGKLRMPEKLLKNQCYLTREEVQLMESHPETGQKLVGRISGFEHVAEIILCHHEKYNGSGYPRQLSEENIPLGARVIAVTDMFDNMVCRHGLKFQQACAELKNLAGSDLDPELVDTFLGAIVDSYNGGVFEEKIWASAGENEEQCGDIVQQLRNYLDKSWVLGNLNLSYVILYEKNEFKSLGNSAVPEAIVNNFADCALKGFKTGTCQKEFIIDAATGKIFNSYFMPVSGDSCLIAVFDMTDVLKSEKDREERELLIYRDVMLAVTQGKLLLVFGNEIDRYVNEGIVSGEMNLVEPQDVAAARSMIKEVLNAYSISGKRKTQMVLCVSEAATNVIKHVGEGKIRVNILEDAIRVIIQDNGPGIDISQLPQVTLRKGYSTKLSLGFGFSIMLDFLDRLIISTQNGTVLILDMALNTEEESVKMPGEEVMAGHHAC